LKVGFKLGIFSSTTTPILGFISSILGAMIIEGTLVSSRTSILASIMTSSSDSISSILGSTV